MTIRSLYFKGVVLPAVVAIILTVVFSAIDNNDYKSEWLTKSSVILMTFGVSFIHSLIISLLALTIFLNNKIIKSNGISTFLSWFVLPITWIAITVYKTIDHRVNYETGTTGQLAYLVTLNLPFIIGLIWTYIVFARQSNNR